MSEIIALSFILAVFGVGFVAGWIKRSQCDRLKGETDGCAVSKDDFMLWLDKQLEDHNGMLDEVAYDAIEKLSARYSAVPEEIRP